MKIHIENTDHSRPSPQSVAEAVQYVYDFLDDFVVKEDGKNVEGAKIEAGSINVYITTKLIPDNETVDFNTEITVRDKPYKVSNSKKKLVKSNEESSVYIYKSWK